MIQLINPSYVKAANSGIGSGKKLFFSSRTANYKRAYKLCWKCKHRLKCSSLLCTDSIKNGVGSCGIIQPVCEDVNFTEVFFPDKGQLPVSEQFKVEYVTLKENYLNLQKKVHPDLWAVKSAELEEIAKVQSSFVNRGFYTLKDPVRRARYLLSLEGIGSEETISHDEGFLECIFDLTSDINSGSEALAEAAYKEAIKLNDNLNKALEDSFSIGDLKLANKYTEMLQYVRKVLEAGKGRNLG